MSIRRITTAAGTIPYGLISGAPPSNPTLSDVLTNGNTTGGLDILGASSNIETDALKCVSIRPLAFPVQTDIIIDGNLAMEDNTNIDFGTDVDIQIDNQQVIYTDGSTNVIFSNVPRTSVAPSIGDDLCNKTYVDAQVTSAGIVDSVVAGTGISVNSSDPINPIVSNTGVLDATAGSGISITGTKANYTIANSGVLDNTAGSGISITGTKANYTIANSGVLDATAGSGISITGTKANYTIANDGVLNNTAGSGITITGTKADYTIANSGVLDATAGSGISITGTKANYTIANSGVLDNTAGSGISITGTKANYTIANNGVLDLTAGTAISITGSKSNYTINAVIPAQTTPTLAQVMDISSVASQNLLMNSNDITGVNDLTGNTATFNDLFCSPVSNAQISLNKTVVSSQQLIKNTYYVNDNVVDIQTMYDDHATEQGIVFKISSGSYGGSTLTINNSSNQFFECPDAGNGSTITELASGRGLTITNSSRIRFSALQIEGAFTINGKHSSVAGTNCIFSNCEFLGGCNIGSVVNNISGFITFYQCAFAGGALNIQPGTATIYFINCDFGNQVISNTGSPAQVVINNGANLNTLVQSAYIGVGTLASAAGVAQISTNQLTTPLNTGSITSRQIEVASDPGTSNALTRKSYVDAQVATKVGSVVGGTAITIGGTSTSPIINNAGVTSLTAGTNITLSGSTGAITISATGGGGGGGNVNSVSAGTGISISGTSADPVVNNTGVLDNTAGTGISISGTKANYTIANTGVLSITAGTGLSSTQVTPGNPTLNNEGVLELTAGTAIGISGTKSNYTITNNGVRQINSGTGISVGGTSTAPTVTNVGVTSIIAGSGISVSSATGAVTITNTGGGGGGGAVNSVSAGQAITITGTASAPIINQSRFTYQVPTVNTGPVDSCLDFGYNWICANPATGTLIASGGQIASGTDQIVCIRSTDGGNTWSIPLDPNNQQTWRDPESGNACYDIRRAWCLEGIWFLQNRTTPLKSLLRSADDGLTWQKVNTPTTDTVNDIAVMTGTGNMIAVTNSSASNGRKWSSTNYGQTWGTLSNTIGGRTVIIRSIDYAVDPVLGYGVFVITTNEATSSPWKVAFCDTALNNFQSAFTTSSFAFGGTLSAVCCRWVPTKNKWFVFFSNNITGNDPNNNTINVGAVTGPGMRAFWAPTVSNNPADIALPFKNPTQRLIYTGSINIDFAVVNSLGEIFIWCTDAQTTGYKVLYQRADQLNQFMPLEVLSSSESGASDSVNHCFTYTGSRWIGCMGRQTTRSGAWVIQAPLALP